MKVLIDAAILRRPAGGTQRYVTRLLEAFARLPDGPEVVRSEGLPLLPRGNALTKLGNFLVEQVRLNVAVPLEARRRRVDLVHWPANTMSRVGFAPSVVSIMDLNFLTAAGTYDPAFAAYATRMYRHAAHAARAVITISEWTRAQLVETFDVDPARIFVTPLGVEWPSASPEPAAGGSFVLSVAHFEPHKDLPTLVRAFDRASSADPGLRLVLAGRPGRDLARVRAAIDAATSRARIDVILDPSDDRLDELYRAARIFALPSRAEGFGLPPLEAMARGRPVVASRAGALPEVLGDDALWFEAGDAEGLAERLEQLIGDDTLRAELGERGRSRARRYSWEATARGTLEVYRHVLGT